MSMVSEQGKLDWNMEGLVAFLNAQLQLELSVSSLEFRPVGGGFSNPTFFMLCLDTGREWVLRKQPEGDLLPSAHAIDREYRVMQALANTSVPLPNMLLFCDDRSYVGTPFYLMEKVEGRVFHDNRLPEIPAAERGAYYQAMNQTLAALHKVDYRQVGLETFGKPSGFIERQIRLWTGQYERSKTQTVTEIEQLGEWLNANRPEEDETTIVHGDFRLGNLMFHPTKPEVVAVLDWELSTLGHPMSDVGYNLMIWKMTDAEFHGIADQDFTTCGIPTYDEYLNQYLSNRALETGFDRFYLAFSFFRLAVIFDGVLSRGGQQADAHQGVDISQLNHTFARIGLQVAHNRI